MTRPVQFLGRIRHGKFKDITFERHVEQAFPGLDKIIAERIVIQVSVCRHVDCCVVLLFVVVMRYICGVVTVLHLLLRHHFRVLVAAQRLEALFFAKYGVPRAASASIFFGRRMLLQ